MFVILCWITRIDASAGTTWDKHVFNFYGGDPAKIYLDFDELCLNMIEFDYLTINHKTIGVPKELCHGILCFELSWIMMNYVDL